MDAVLITEENIERFEKRILPGILAELKAALLDTEDENLPFPYLVLGAEEEGEVLGAAAARMEEEGDLQLLSLYADADMRRTGVGSFLLDSLLSLASRLFSFDEGENEAEVQVKCLYALPDPSRRVFEAFLRANNFTDFHYGSPLYELKGNSLMQSGILPMAQAPADDGSVSLSSARRPADDGLIPLSSLPSEDLDNLRTHIGSSFLPEISFVEMAGGTENLLFLADRINPGLYRVNLVFGEDDTPLEKALEALNCSLHAISRLEKNRDFTLQIRAGRPDTLAFLDSIADEDTRVIQTVSAWMDVILRREKADTPAGSR